MPELPEVETVVQSIRHKLIGNEFEKIDLRWPKVLFNFSKSDFSNNLVKRKIQRVDRRAWRWNYRSTPGQGCHSRRDQHGRVASRRIRLSTRLCGARHVRLPGPGDCGGGRHGRNGFDDRFPAQQLPVFCP